MGATGRGGQDGGRCRGQEVDGRRARAEGARGASDSGGVLAWMESAGRRVCIFSDGLARAAGAVEALAMAHGKVSIAKVGAEPIDEHGLATELTERGFSSGYKGFTLSSATRTIRR